MKILDRYISAKFWRFFLIGVAAFILVFIIVDLVEHIDDYVDKKARVGDVVFYYVLYLPYIVALVSPVGTLIATAFLGGYLVKHHELVALRSSGISTLRVAATLLLWGALISVGTFAMGETLLPYSNRLREKIRDEKIYRRSKRASRLLKDLFYIGENGDIYYFRTFDVRTGVARDVVITRRRGDKIVQRTDARRMFYKNGVWTLTEVIVRKFATDSEELEHYPTLKLNIPEKPADFARKIPSSDEMGFFTLRKYIKKIRRSGIVPYRELTDMWMKIAYALVNLIVIMLGVPMSFKQRKASYVYGFGQSFFLAFLYLAALRAGQAFGYNGTLPPCLAAFLGDIIFGTLGAILLAKTAN